MISAILAHIHHNFVEALIARAVAEGWGAEALQTILSAIPANRWAWDLAHGAGQEAEQEYWKRMEVFKLNLPDNDLCDAIEHLIAVGRARSAAHFAGHMMRSGKIPSELLARVLLEAVQQPFNKERDGNEPTMFQHYVTEILARLDQDPDFDRNIILTLEWAYLPLLEYSRRPAKVITEELARNPELFIQLVCAIWRPSEESGVVDAEQLDPERAESLASHAYRLLHNWSVIPGTQPDGTIDAKELENWVNRVRKLAEEKGRLNPTDLRIGEVLSASPVGEDGIWPALPIRELIERGVRSKRIESGFQTGRYNRRGVTVRSPRDGGQQERDEASWYREMAKKANVEWPRVSGILEDIAKSYDHDAGWRDDDVERLDW